MSYVLYTGPINEVLILADGTAVDVSPEAIVLPTIEQVNEVADLIGKYWEKNHHPRVEGDFIYNRES